MRKSVLLVCTVLLAACQQVPDYRQPTTEGAYYVPTCDEIGGQASNPYISCRHVVRTPPPSACEKRFGKALCEPVSNEQPASSP